MFTSNHDVLVRTGLLPEEEQAAVLAIEPGVEAMFIMMAADGIVGDEEYEVIRGAVRELTEDAIHTQTLNAMLDGFKQALAKDGQDERIRDVARRLVDDTQGQENAFVLAAVVAFADGVIADQENEVLNDIAAALGLTEHRATELLDELESDWKC